MTAPDQRVPLAQREFNRARDYWRIACEFPTDKEEAYPRTAEDAGHAYANGFLNYLTRPTPGIYDGIITPPRHVLEYGCGGGSDTISWMKRGHHVTATDIVPENVTSTRNRAAEYAVAHVGENWFMPKVVLLTESSPLPFADATFDVVSSHGVVHHIVHPLPVLKEFHRVLRPGGRAYVMFYTEHLWATHVATINWLTMSKGLDPHEAFGWCTDGEGTPYSKHYTVLEATKLFQEARFQIVQFVETNKKEFRTFWLEAR